MSAAAIDAIFSRALAAHQQGRWPEAAQGYQEVLRQAPTHSDALHLLGVLAQQSGNQDSALLLIREAIRLRPQIPDYHFNLGVSCQSAALHADAVAAYQACLQLQPARVEAWLNLAVALQALDRLPEAVAACDAALQRNPQYGAALQNRATLAFLQGEPQRAEQLLLQLLQQQPMLAEARDKLAQLRLARGDFASGWRDYAWRAFSPSFLAHNPPRVLPFPAWNGERLQGKRLLLVADLGVGDIVMHLSCLPELLHDADAVLLECEARWLPLLQRSFPQVQLLPRATAADGLWQQSWGRIDCQALLSELPMFRRPALEAFPKQQEPWLQADAARVAAWRALLDALGPGLKVGIAWQGGADAQMQRQRSLPLQQWLPLAAVPGIHLVSLQYGDHAESIAAFNAEAATPLQQLPGLDAIADLDGYAALLQALDLVVSIDNSTVHFAAALGQPTWVLLPLAAEWRWLQQRSDSPWYPSLRLFRATAPGAAGLAALLPEVLAAVSGFQPAKHSQSPAASTASTTAALPPLPAFDTAAAPVLLLNDTTAWYHWGCSCTSLALHAALQERFPLLRSLPLAATRQLAPLPQSLEQLDSDALWQAFRERNAALLQLLQAASQLVINGEGTLHRLSSASLGLLYLAHVAVTRLGKRVSIINHSCYPLAGEAGNDKVAAALYARVYAGLDSVVVRESASRRELAELGIASAAGFDCLPLYLERFYQRSARLQQGGGYLLLAGSVAWGETMYSRLRSLLPQLRQLTGLPIRILLGARAGMAADDIAFVQALAPLPGQDCELLFTRNEQEWLQAIEQAALLLSGRFHHSMAAAFLGTPFLVMGSNTPKISGLLDMLQLPQAFVDEQAADLEQRLPAAVQAALQPDGACLLSAARRTELLELAQVNFSGLQA